MKDPKPLANESSRRLTIHLEFLADGSHRVRLCEIAHGEMRHRSSWRSKVSVFEAFASHFADVMVRLLWKLKGKSQLICFPDFSFSNGVVSLDNVTLAAHETSSGGLTVSVSFGHFKGPLTGVLIGAALVEGEAGEDKNELSDRILLDLCMPLLNICQFSQLGLPIETLGAERAMTDLAHRASEISFHVEMIKRHLAQKNDASNDAGEPRQLKVPPLASLVRA